MSEKLYCLFISLCIIWTLAACNIRPDPSLIPTQVSSIKTSTPGVVSTDSPTRTLPVNTPEIETITPDLPPEPCLLGLGLRQQTVPIVAAYQDQPGFVMTASAVMAEEYFHPLKGWIRTLGAPSLEALEQKAMRAEENNIPYEALSYGLETSQSTPDEEWQDLIGSTRAARAIADKYDKLLVMGPGFRLMSQNEDKYPIMAALADIWVLQTQRLQVNPPGQDYRDEVERVVDLIRSGNSDISIWAQITLPPDREPDSSEWLAYRESIADLVRGTYIGIYTWDTVDNDQLVMTAEEIFAQVCGNEG
jgi:hypothetical protein